MDEKKIKRTAQEVPVQEQLIIIIEKDNYLSVDAVLEAISSQTKTLLKTL